MNKNILISAIILLLLAGVVIVISVNKDKGIPSTGENENPPVEEVPSNGTLPSTVNLENNIGVNELVIDGITIKNIVVINEQNKQQLEFIMESTQPLPNMTLEVALLNDVVVNRKMKFTFEEEKYSEFIIMDFTGSFNNPNQIYFSIEKN